MHGNGIRDFFLARFDNLILGSLCIDFDKVDIADFLDIIQSVGLDRGAFFNDGPVIKVMKMGKQFHVWFE